MDEIVREIFLFIISFNVKTYLVGGSIRDSLLGRVIKDFDFVTIEKPQKLAENIACIFGGTVVEMSKEHEMFRVVVKNVGTFDFSKIKGEKIEEDLYERDFSINAMAYDLNNSYEIEKNMIIDPFGGMRDLESNRIRHLHKETFVNDPLRMIRAVSLMSRLNFDLDEETQKLIKAESETINTIAGERIATEFFAILREKRSAY